MLVDLMNVHWRPYSILACRDAMEFVRLQDVHYMYISMKFILSIHRELGDRPVLIRH
jgi:hypothetical protein